MRSVRFEILGRVGKRSVERVRYVINNLLHLGSHCEIWSHFARTLYYIYVPIHHTYLMYVHSL